MSKDLTAKIEKIRFDDLNLEGDDSQSFDEEEKEYLLSHNQVRQSNKKKIFNTLLDSINDKLKTQKNSRASILEQALSFDLPVVSPQVLNDI